MQKFNGMRYAYDVSYIVICIWCIVDFSGHEKHGMQRRLPLVGKADHVETLHFIIDDLP